MLATLSEVEFKLFQAYETVAILREFLQSPEALKAENFKNVINTKENIIKLSKDIAELECWHSVYDPMVSRLEEIYERS